MWSYLKILWTKKGVHINKTVNIYTNVILFKDSNILYDHIDK